MLLRVLLTISLIYVYSEAGLLEDFIQPLNRAEVHSMVALSCSTKNYMCPRPEFATFEKIGKYTWNANAIDESPATDILMSGILPRMHVIPFLRENFCCLSGPCLQRCGIFKIKEIGLIRGFPNNVDLLFSLNFKGLEEFRQPVYNFLERTAWKHTKPPFPAEIEEYFDFLHAHRHALGNRIRQEMYKATLQDSKNIV